jgi:pilus assembly protein CpaE
MSRQALIVQDAGGTDQVLEQTLQRYGYGRLSRVGSVSEALVLLDAEGTDLLIVPIDAVDEMQLAALDRVNRRDRDLGVIATGPRAEPELMLRAMRAGIQEFLVRPLDPTELTTAVERVFRRTSAAVAGGQVYAVFGAKGGVGTSTVAVNLSYALTRVQPESRIAVADLALPGGDIRLLLNVRPAYDLGDIAEKIDRLDADLMASVMVPATDGLWVLSAPERPEAEEIIDAGVATTVVKQLRRAYNYSVLDCEHQLNDRALAALDAADRIVLLTELKVPALRAAQRTLGVFRRLGYPNEKLAVVVNRYQSGDVVTTAEAADVLKTDIYFRLPNDYRTCSQAATDGVPVGAAFPDTRLAAAYQQLAQKLSGVTGVAGDRAGTNGSRSRLRTMFSRKRS